MAGLINLRLLTDFFNKIGHVRAFRPLCSSTRFDAPRSLAGLTQWFTPQSRRIVARRA